ncbi:MAG: DNA repair protein RadA [Acidimicrobiales bacterium]|nr:DNA repair protein RadA [Acidimicrobiales bacterium]
MAKTRSVHRCTACGWESAKWAGRCDGCGEWNSLVEELDVRDPSSATFDPPTSELARIGDVTDGGATAHPTGVGEVDRVLGGGLVDGSVTLIGGEPGIGKSTLLLQLVGSTASAGLVSLYVSGEESAGQVKARADRLGAIHDDLWLVAETALPHILAHLESIKPDVVVIDSVQTLHDPALASAPGSVAQVRECANRLVAHAKRHGTTVLLVGHVTKEGTLAGPRVLEHVVDTVLEFDGDRHHGLRLLRATKHRFGATTEVGLLQMDAAGLAAVDDPSGLFLADRVTGISGSAVVPTVDGNRPLLVEVQALVAQSSLSNPRRSAQGVDSGRLAMLLAVLERRCGLQVGTNDVYTLAVGGARVFDPGADVALALAIASSLSGQPLGDDVVAVGEVGLGGELRQVSHLDRRLNEAARMGFRRAIVPQGTTVRVDGLQTLQAPTLRAAVALADVGSEG